MIARYDAATGWLPAVCPKHGFPADRSIKRRFASRTPWWVWLLFIVSLLIMLIVVVSMTKSDNVALPGCSACTDGTRLRRAIRWGTGLLTGAICVAGIAFANGGLPLLAIPPFLVWVIAMLSVGDSAGAVTGTIDGPHLRLRGVHPAFIAALRPNPAWNYVPQQPVPPPAYQPLPQGWGSPH